MKKLLSILLALTLVFSLAACGGNPNEKNIVGVWHVTDEETETDYGLGIEFTKDGKVRYGLTEDVFTALAEGNEEDAETAMKVADALLSMEYEIISDTEIEVTAKALLGLKKEKTTITYSLDGDKLTFDGSSFVRVTEDGKSEAKNEKEDKEEKKEEKEDKKENKSESGEKPAEYDPTAWLEDNTSISFYFMYQDGAEDNELLTLKVLEDKAVLYSKKGEGEEQPITIYEETDEGIVVTQLLYVGDKKGAFQNLPKTEVHSLMEYLPKTGNVMATFGARGDKDAYRNKEITREEKYIGRKCDVIENFTLAGTSTTHLDQETGIILKSEAILKSGDTESRVVQALVTELEYGKVTKDDVTVDLSDYELTVEEPKEEKEEAKAE